MSTTAVSPRLSTDPGVLRGLQRVLSEDGFIEILAIDHGLDIAVLLDEDPTRVGFGDVAAAKDLVIRAVGDVVSAVLVDAAYGGHLVAAGAFSSRTGLVVGVEDEDYQIPPGPRGTRLRADWSLRQLRDLGADMAKLLWWFRPDTDGADGQRELLDRVIAEAHAVSVPIVVEPIWYPLPGEDTGSAEWKAARVRGIIESAVEIDQRGADLLKLEFPGYVDDADGRAAATDAAQEVDDRTSAPWTILSAGVGYEAFVTQVEIASKAGASGYLAGRSMWRDPLGVEASRRAESAKTVRQRFERLNAIMSANGRPVTASRPLGDSIESLGDHWYA